MRRWLKRITIFISFLFIWGAIAAWYFAPSWGPQLLVRLVARTGAKVKEVRGISLGLNSITITQGELHWDLPDGSKLTSVVKNLRIEGDLSAIRDGRANRVQVETLDLSYATKAVAGNKTGVDLWNLFNQVKLPVDSISVTNLTIHSSSPGQVIDATFGLDYKGDEIAFSKDSRLSISAPQSSVPDLTLTLLTDLVLSKTLQESLTIAPMQIGVGKLSLPGKLNIDELTISVSDVSITTAGIHAKYTIAGQFELPSSGISRTAATVRGVLSLSPTSPLPEVLAGLSVPKLDLGFPITALVASLTFRPSSPSKISVSSVRASILGGTIRLDPFVYNSKTPKMIVTSHLQGIDLDVLLKMYPESQVTGTGIVDGTLPTTIDKNGITISGGTLEVRPPGGTIKGDLSSWVQAHPENPGIALAARALRDLRYHQLKAGVSYGETGDLELQLSIKGKNPDLNEGQPLNVNITIGENIPSLLKTMDLINNGPRSFTDR